MILQASQRSGARQLATHLMRMDENDHVQVHSIRGFMSDNVKGAFNEAYAVSKGTKCKQFLFSLSLNPPPNAQVSTATFEKTIGEVEKRLGLTGQPRVIVFHEKFGRRHAHCVWSRIDARAMKAINLPHFKLTLQSLSRELYIEHSWEMPKGFLRSADVSPLNFTLAEWQHAKRLDKDPKRIKAAFQDCWAASDSGIALRAALEQRGYFLARGDRRAVVVLDWKGEVYSLSRWTGANAAAIKHRLGDLALPSVADITSDLRRKLDEKRADLGNAVQNIFDEARLGVRAKRDALIQRQRAERAAIVERQALARKLSIQEHLSRFRKGLKGLWDRITGKHAAIRTEILRDASALEASFRDQHDAIVERQLTERREIQNQLREAEQRHAKDRERLNRDFRLEIVSTERVITDQRTRRKRQHRRTPTP